MISLSHHATDFTGDVRQFGERVQICLPGVEQLLFDVRLPQVIQDKDSIGGAAYQFNDRGYLPVLDAQVKRKVIFRQLARTLDEIGPQAEIRFGFVLDIAPHPP